MSTQIATLNITIEIEAEISESGDLLDVFTNSVSIKHALKRSEQLHIKLEAIEQITSREECSK